MKKLAILILLSLFVLVGCQDDSSILAPNNDYASDEMSKGRPILSFGESTNGLLEEPSDSTSSVKPNLSSVVDEITGEKLSK
jgi:uncharacterized protein YcfL